MNIYLEREARLIIVFASIEAHARETLGLLLGYRTAKEAIVKLAIPYQTSKRKFSEVEPPRKESQLVKTLPDLPTAHMDILGGFHSHPSWGEKWYEPVPTESDKEWIIKNKGIEVIVALKKAKKYVEPGVRQSGEVSGSVGPYYYKIAGYYEDDGEVKKATLTTAFDY
ncbi:MAG: hypothetical protein H3Z52_10505 [archaeon]|nr:hypothetical protein [archaeon]MCP8321352.1 hypothetical protein [archaeon]